MMSLQSYTVAVRDADCCAVQLALKLLILLGKMALRNLNKINI